MRYLHGIRIGRRGDSKDEFGGWMELLISHSTETIRRIEFSTLHPVSQEPDFMCDRITLASLSSLMSFQRSDVRFKFRRIKSLAYVNGIQNRWTSPRRYWSTQVDI